MTERQLQFRVGLFVILSGAAIAGMVFYFGEIAQMWEPRYPLVVHFENAPGVFPGTPVRRNGISIGKVQEVVFDEHRGGVLTLISIAFLAWIIRSICSLQFDNCKLSIDSNSYQCYFSWGTDVCTWGRACSLPHHPWCAAWPAHSPRR